jgi:DNA-binding transcriptional LysR family regulator
MDTRFLQSFIAVVESGSIAEAARRLDLTPAAVAARIRTLEEDLGVALVSRAGRVVRPTEAGLQILDQSRSVVRSMSELRSAAVERTGSGQLRIGTFFSAATSIISPVLESLYRDHPDLSVFVDVGYSPELSAKVIAGELDAAVVVEHQFVMPKACEWHALVEEPLVVIAPGSFSGAEDAHHLLRTQPFIKYDRRIWGGRLADRYLRERNIHPRVRLEIDGLMTIASFVSNGLGISLLPNWGPMWGRNLSLTRIPLPGVVPMRRIGLLRTVRGSREKFVDEFLGHAISVCRPEADCPRSDPASAPDSWDTCRTAGPEKAAT